MEPRDTQWATGSSGLGGAPQVGGSGFYVHDNLCDNVADKTPYYIGGLRTAATNCSEQCPPSTYQETNQVCLPCGVVGCRSCSPDGCEDCLIFHLPMGGQCVYLFGGIFLAAAIFFVTVLLAVSLRFCCTSLFTPKNSEVLRAVLAHRRRAKAHDYSLPGNPFYAYDETNVRRQGISGVGPTLYFRFVAYLAGLCFLMVILLVAGFFALGDGQAIGLTGAQREVATLGHALALYLGVLLVTVHWMASQSRMARETAEEEPHLRNYALVAEGFPKSARSPHEVKAYFESLLGFEMEGVSIAYDHAEEIEFVDDRVLRLVEKADTNLGVYPSELSGLESQNSDAQDGHVLDCLMASGSAFVVFTREEDREFCLRRFEEIGRQLKAAKESPLGDPDSPEDSEDDEATSLLKAEGGGGRGVRGGAARAGRRGRGAGPSRAVLFRGKFPIRVGQAPEPCGVQWWNFSVRRGTKYVRVVIALLVSLLLVALVGAVMFAPAVLAEMSYIIIDEPTAEQARFIALEQAIVSLSMAVNNRVLCAVLRRAASASGFVQRPNEDVAYALCAFVACALASALPFAVASAVAASDDTTITRPLAVAWLFQVLWMNMVCVEAWRVLGHSWSYWSSYFWIRQSRYVSVRDGEPALTPPAFPCAERYVDLLHALALVCAMIAISSTSMYTIAGQSLLLLYVTYAYFSDKYMFLRVSRQTHFASPRLDACAHYLVALPLAALLALPFQCRWLSLESTVGARPWLKPVLYAVCALLPLALAHLCQRCNEPHRELSDVPYVEVASLVPYNYFNANPVHVLRTLHFPSVVVPPIYPYLPGKEYLQGGQFSDHDDSVRLRDTLMLLVRAPLKGMDDFANPQDLG
eukprot:TRINITY_DN17112_c0_g4_i1.p1 TRINITY_DN17112_c0_g4~~TRINITY_DN17112_c0_g4_i1.p1  ORF type:complete len:901 (-),score=190.39 TRINITY_DN17112_c0_g4_i1:82-2670(-)